MKLLETKNQLQRISHEKHSFWEYCEFVLFLPCIFAGVFYAKVSVYFRTGKKIGETF